MPFSVNRWFEDNRWAGDAVLAFILLVIAAPAASFGVGRERISIAFTVLLILPLFARRTKPLGVLASTSVLCLMQIAILETPVAGDIAVPIVIHAAAAYIPDRRWGFAALAAGLGGVPIATLRWGWASHRTGYFPSLGSVSALFLAGVAVVVAAYLLGIRHRDRREHTAEQLAAVTERNRLLEAERGTRTDLGAAAERARIARELHDIVAHSLSVIVVQADGGAAAARAKPEVGPQVLDTIAATSRDALAQMRRMVSVLRAGPSNGNDDSDRYAPAPGPADLGALIDQVRAAGLPVQFDTIGTPRTMTPDAGLAIYRAVQESLTNVLKHAGPNASCRVVPHYAPQTAVVTVTDDGRGAAAAFHTEADPDATDTGAPAEAGHGLEGMRERVTLYGGHVQAGPLVGGGFEVSASVPYGPENPGMTLPSTPPDPER